MTEGVQILSLIKDYWIDNHDSQKNVETILGIVGGLGGSYLIYRLGSAAVTKLGEIIEKMSSGGVWQNYGAIRPKEYKHRHSNAYMSTPLPLPPEPERLPVDAHGNIWPGDAMVQWLTSHGIGANGKILNGNRDISNPEYAKWLAKGGDEKK